MTSFCQSRWEDPGAHLIPHTSVLCTVCTVPLPLSLGRMPRVPNVNNTPPRLTRYALPTASTCPRPWPHQHVSSQQPSTTIQSIRTSCSWHQTLFNSWASPDRRYFQGPQSTRRAGRDCHTYVESTSGGRRKQGEILISHLVDSLRHPLL
jgi:hypothetical protein